MSSLDTDEITLSIPAPGSGNLQPTHPPATRTPPALWSLPVLSSSLFVPSFLLPTPLSSPTTGPFVLSLLYSAAPTVLDVSERPHLNYEHARPRHEDLV